MGFLAKYGKRRERDSRRTPEPAADSLVRLPIERLHRIVGQFDPSLTVSQDKQHLAFSSLLTDILLMAQGLLKVKTQLKARAQLVGRELA